MQAYTLSKPNAGIQTAICLNNFSFRHCFPIFFYLITFTEAYSNYSLYLSLEQNSRERWYFYMQRTQHFKLQPYMCQTLLWENKLTQICFHFPVISFFVSCFLCEERLVFRLRRAFSLIHSTVDSFISQLLVTCHKKRNGARKHCLYSACFGLYIGVDVLQCQTACSTTSTFSGYRKIELFMLHFFLPMCTHTYRWTLLYSATKVVIRDGVPATGQLEYSFQVWVVFVLPNYFHFAFLFYYLFPFRG